MIQDDIINELKYIPESELIKLYEFIHTLRLKFDSENQKQTIAGCLKEYAHTYIPTEQATQQAWQAVINEKYHRS
ncbi:MAG: hypothetical protein Q7U23_16425 [Methylococcales bacterium]|nr:hypothetical protein [Methylococcales bacterium]